MTVLFLSCKREATHGPHGVSKKQSQWLILNIFHFEILWAESLLVGLSTLSWRLPRNIGNLRFLVIPSDGSGHMKAYPCFSMVTPIGQHQVKHNVLILAANGQWNLSSIYLCRIWSGRQNTLLLSLKFFIKCKWEYYDLEGWALWSHCKSYWNWDP